MKKKRKATRRRSTTRRSRAREEAAANRRMADALGVVRPGTTTTYVLTLTKVESWQDGNPPASFGRKTPMGSVDVPERVVVALTAEGTKFEMNVPQLLYERGMMGDHYINAGDIIPAPREAEVLQPTPEPVRAPSEEPS